MTTDDSAAAAHRAVIELLAATEPGAFAPHHRHGEPLATSTTWNVEPHPLVAVRASGELVRTLQRQVAGAVLLARASGESWEAVADALDLGSGDCSAADEALRRELACPRLAAVIEVRSGVQR